MNWHGLEGDNESWIFIKMVRTRIFKYLLNLLAWSSIRILHRMEVNFEVNKKILFRLRMHLILFIPWIIFWNIHGSPWKNDTGSKTSVYLIFHLLLISEYLCFLLHCFLFSLFWSKSFYNGRIISMSWIGSNWNFFCSWFLKSSSLQICAFDIRRISMLLLTSCYFFILV